MELIERELDGIARQLIFYIPAAHAHKQQRAGNQQKLRRAEDDRRRFVRQEVYIRQGDGRDDRTEQNIIDSADTGYGYARRGNRLPATPDPPPAANTPYLITSYSLPAGRNIQAFS